MLLAVLPTDFVAYFQLPTALVFPFPKQFHQPLAPVIEDVLH